MKSDIELQKSMIVQKAKGYPIKEKYQKAFSQWDVIVSKRSKRSNDRVKCKAPSYVIKSFGRSYMHASIIEMDHMI